MGHAHKVTEFGHVGMMCIRFIYILSTVSFDIFIREIKQLIKFISCLTTVTSIRILSPHDHYSDDRLCWIGSP